MIQSLLLSVTGMYSISGMRVMIYFHCLVRNEHAVGTENSRKGRINLHKVERDGDAEQHTVQELPLTFVFSDSHFPVVVHLPH
jgi:hypothetical protein